MYAVYGTFWYDDPIRHKNGEFDCVVRKTGDLYDFYECKYYDRPMKMIECEEEETQVREIMSLNQQMIDQIGFVCTGGFDLKDENRYQLIDGEMLYLQM